MDGWTRRWRELREEKSLCSFVYETSSPSPKKKPPSKSILAVILVVIKEEERRIFMKHLTMCACRLVASMLTSN